MTLNLRQKLRANHVKRWHIVETVRPQSVAEHSFNVALITEELCRAIGMNETETLYALKYALFHDVAEVVLGDIPTPVKGIIGENSMALVDEVAAEAVPSGVCSDVLVVKLVKLADMLDAATFITTYGIGKHASLVADGVRESVWGMMSKFTPAARKALSPLVVNILQWDTTMDIGEGVAWHTMG